VFFFILVYPYFSNAQEPTDLCPNIDGVQETVPEGQEINQDGECVPSEQNPEETSASTITGTITYSPSSSTTGPVTATLTWFSTTGVTITNNSGNNTKIFAENGSFEFLFENTDGLTGSALATVDWIEDATITQECEIAIQTPTSGSLVSSVFTITWSIDECDDEYISIQLRDHNNQRIEIGTWSLEDEEFIFHSTWLASTGFYTITGVHLSGTTYSGIVYTEDTIYNIYTGAYNGAYTDYATGYKVRLISTQTQETLVEQTGTFTIDNQKPTITSLTWSFAPVFSWSIGKVWVMTASFTASEQLTGGTTFTILWTTVIPTATSQNGNTYTYTVPLASVVSSGALVFTAHVADLAGNTWVAYGTSSIIFNNQLPAINNLIMTGANSGSVTLSWTTNIATKYNFSYYKSGTTTTTAFTGTVYATGHNHTLTGIQNNSQYPFSLMVSDNLGNTKWLSGTLNASTTWALSINIHNSNDIIQLSWQVEANLYLQILQNEINKFQACRAAITFTNHTIPVGTKSIVIRKPTITKPSVNQIMWAFLVLFTNKIKDRTELSQAELNIVADAVNNFLIVIKLVDDDDSSCEQKMSTYYLSQFEQIMTNLNFF
jgi:hypothetical protein